MAWTVKYLRFMEIKSFSFIVEAFEFSKFYESEAKHDKHDFRRGLSMVFKVSELKLLEGLA